MKLSVPTSFIYACSSYRSNPSSSSFRAGSSNYNSGGQVVGVSQVFEHERYDGEDYDFALFILSSSLNFGANIAAVALPAQGQSVADNAPATTSGWGAIYVSQSCLTSLPWFLQEQI